MAVIRNLKDIILGIKLKAMEIMRESIVTYWFKEVSGRQN